VRDGAQLLVEQRNEPVQRLATAATQHGENCRGL
jgi:hypothetical protein